MNCPRCKKLLDKDSSTCSSCGYNNAAALLATLPALPPSGPLMDPLIDMVLDGKYQLTQLIGRGGMGSVYRARRLRFEGTDVAIKVLHKQVIDEDTRRRFRREATAAARLSMHPNIVTIHDFEDGKNDQSLAYIVMELLEGKALNEILRQETRIEPTRAVALMSETCDGVQFAHEQNVIHRDLKPHNIVVLPLGSGGRSETVKLVDFGLAKLRSTQLSSLSESLTPAGTRLGTPVYMSPEACRGESLDARSDIYSLGATMYHMLTGRPPFFAESFLELQWKHVNEKPPSLQINGGKLLALENVIMQALEKDPDKRQQDARSFGTQLRDALNQPVPAPLPAPPSPEPFKPALSEYTFEVARIGSGGEVIERSTGKAKCFRERIGDELLEMVEIPGGRFVMGSPDHEDGRHDDEGPQREVNLKTFYMGKHEITQAQWRAIAASEKINRDVALSPARFRGDKKPVERVSWPEAVEFCLRLSRLTGRAYRLPTEAEWEYACRAGMETPFCCGVNISDDVVNYNSSFPYGNAPSVEGRSTTTAVGSLGYANNFGLFDMLGNVWEWCQDVYRPSYEGAPADGSAWLGRDNMPRVIRGGSWRAQATDCGSAARNSSAPLTHEDDIGFRVVCSSTQIIEPVPDTPVQKEVHQTDPVHTTDPVPELPKIVIVRGPQPPVGPNTPEVKVDEKPAEEVISPEPVRPLKALLDRISNVPRIPILDEVGLSILDPTKPTRVFPFLILTHLLIALLTIDIFVPSIFQNPLESAIWGLVLGFVQVLLLRRYLPAAVWWLLLTMAAAITSALIYKLLGLPWELTWAYIWGNATTQQYPFVDRSTTIVVTVTLRWVIIALLQYIMLRKFVRASLLWPLMICVGAIICGVVVSSLSRALRRDDVFTTYVASVGILLGLAQGFCLMRFKKKS